MSFQLVLIRHHRTLREQNFEFFYCVGKILWCTVDRFRWGSFDGTTHANIVASEAQRNTSHCQRENVRRGRVARASTGCCMKLAARMWAIPPTHTA